MTLTIEQKKTMVADIISDIADTNTAVLAEYRGLNVAQMTELRSQARANDVYFRVMKNTMAKRVVKGSDFECLNDHFTGPIVFAASKDSVAVAKLVSQYAKSNKVLQIKIGAMNGELIDTNEIAELAKLPSREELLAKLMGTMRAPISKFAQTLNEVPSKLVRTLHAYQLSKENETTS